MKLSPLAPQDFAHLPAIAGVRFVTSNSGIRYKGRPDLLLAVFQKGTQVAGVFSRATIVSPTITWNRKQLPSGEACALLVNAGNANAFTGEAGWNAIESLADTLSPLVRCAREEIFVASTGVIGETLEYAKIAAILPDMAESLGTIGWDKAADAIRTTDTFPKLVTRKAMIGDVEVTLNGIAKGSGMIAPNMATMLGFIFTDAAIPAPILQSLLAECTDRSFNSITVDSDCSTNDLVLAFATGAAANIESDSPFDALLIPFKEALQETMTELAQLIVRDGEGASKFITIDVNGAEDAAAARRIGLSIGNSPLVKTAIAGEDANWGRIIMAVGKSAEKIDTNKLTLHIGEVLVASAGACHPDYREEKIISHMQGQEINLHVDVGVGKGSARVWTCDLTHGYIEINADYRS